MPSTSSSSNWPSTAAPPRGRGFSLELLEERPGFALARVAGKGALTLFAGESGGHRWQRVPPTEKRGRVHTSTITIAVLNEPTARELRIDPRELDETFTGGSGKGGQNQNKRSTAVVLVHRPTGLRVRIESRSQHANRVTALAVLRAKLQERAGRAVNEQINRARRHLVGSGMRGDKVRTVSARNNLVHDHRTGRRTTLTRYRRGHLRDLAL